VVNSWRRFFLGERDDYLARRADLNEEANNSELRMRKEFRLTIYAIGEDDNEAIESAVKMLNEGAAFDDVVFQRELPQETIDDD
jgi:hypothetical protein